MIPRRIAHLRPSGSPAAELVQYPQALPVFIVGSVRSGTSAIMTALREGAQIPGFNEGVLAHLLPALLSAVREHYTHQHQKPMTMLGSVPEEFLATGIKNLFGKAFIETMGEGRWLDKTPGGASMVAACPSLLEIFPNAKFVYCQRRGIENVLSRQSKFADRDFEAHCQGWALTMEAWLEVSPLLGNAALAVDQRDMALEPETVAAKLAAFLGLSDAQRDAIAGALRSRRLEQTRARQDEAAIRLADTGWSEAEQDIFRRVCGPMMTAFGYEMDGEGQPGRKAIYQFFVPVTDGVVLRENMSDRKACRALDSKRFKINPNPYGAPAAGIRHRNLDMSAFRRFSARVKSIGPGAFMTEGLIFRFALERPDDRVPVFSAEQVVKAGPGSEWICDLPSLSGAFDAVLSARPVAAETHRQPISALWVDARLS